MKRPLIYGLTALCVLSTPTLITEFNNPTFTKVYRSIASSEVIEFVENLDAANEETITLYKNEMQSKIEVFSLAVKEHQKLKSREDFKDLPDLEKNNLKDEEVRLLSESKKISSYIQTGIKKLTTTSAQEVPIAFLSDFNSVERDLKNAVITNPISKKVAVEAVAKVEKEDKSEVINKEDTTTEKSVVVEKTDDTNACEKIDPIAQLQAQVKELLKDKEEALAKVEKQKDDKKERETKFKEAQKVYALGMFFGQGFRASQNTQMFNFQHPMSQFSIQSQFSNFVRPNTNPWMSLMSKYFSGNRGTASVVNNNYFGEAPARNSIRNLDQESRSYIPKFSRSLVEDDSISFN